MARTEGPLFSLEASGTLAKTLVYSKWKGRPYVRERVIPKNPRTAKQTGIRAMFAFVAAYWDSIATVTQDTWNAAAAALSVTPFNAYVRANLKRWIDDQSPTQADPAAATSTGLTVTTQTITGATGMVTCTITPSGSTDIWGIAIFRDPLTFSAADWTKLRKIIPANGSNAVTWIDDHVDPGTYYYAAQVMNIDGKTGALHAASSATVT